MHLTIVTPQSHLVQGRQGLGWDMSSQKNNFPLGGANRITNLHIPTWGLHGDLTLSHTFFNVIEDI